MTAEIAVINKSAVALAADSAVTIATQDSSGRQGSKIFNTANKLFTLSKYNPVGIMVYNNSELGGIPWETIIKEFRKTELKNNTFDTLQEYKDCFFNFLGTCRYLFEERQQEETLLDGYSGIVIAGFGEKEMFPTVYECYVDAVVSNGIKRKNGREFTPSNSESGKVLGFAQDDIIETILRGINPDCFDDLLDATITLITELPDKIIDKIEELTDAQKNDYKQFARDSAKPIGRNFIKNFVKKAQQKHTFQIESAVAVMPFSELATVAEVFINLTQIRQRMSPYAETVGGPIDVAVISKADGFIWIKRKHYFDTKLNHSFLKNYFR